MIQPSHPSLAISLHGIPIQRGQTDVLPLPIPTPLRKSPSSHRSAHQRRTCQNSISKAESFKKKIDNCSIERRLRRDRGPAAAESKETRFCGGGLRGRATRAIREANMSNARGYACLCLWREIQKDPRKGRSYRSDRRVGSICQEVDGAVHVRWLTVHFFFSLVFRGFSA